MIRAKKNSTVYKGLQPASGVTKLNRCTRCHINPPATLESHVPFVVIAGPGRVTLEYGRPARWCRECIEANRKR